VTARKEDEVSEQLYWHCIACGNSEPAQPEHERGDCEPCCLCEDGTAIVMTLQEGAQIEQRVALGIAPACPYRDRCEGTCEEVEPRLRH
jgi:hypothetical protein